MAYKILLVEDNVDIYNWINDHNKKNRLHYDIRNIKSSEDVLGYLRNQHIDLIITAWTFENPQRGHLEIIKELKLNTTTANIPIIVCTRKESIDDQVKALDQGADDYFRKSAPLPLLFSKMNALLRKIDPEKNNRVILMRKFFFFEDSLEVEHYGTKHKLSNKEFKILKTLCENPGKVFSQEDLNKITSGEEVFVGRRCIDTFVTLLRKKIGKECIVSVKKKGYKLNEALIDPTTEIFKESEES